MLAVHSLLPPFSLTRVPEKNFFPLIHGVLYLQYLWVKAIDSCLIVQKWGFSIHIAVLRHKQRKFISASGRTSCNLHTTKGTCCESSLWTCLLIVPFINLLSLSQLNRLSREIFENCFLLTEVGIFSKELAFSKTKDRNVYMHIKQE